MLRGEIECNQYLQVMLKGVGMLVLQTHFSGLHKKRYASKAY